MALAADLWPALVDPTQIESVILNLAINTRDAMPSGCVLPSKRSMSSSVMGL
jgi:signal transduction histidine kinase